MQKQPWLKESFLAATRPPMTLDRDPSAILANLLVPVVEACISAEPQRVKVALVSIDRQVGYAISKYD